MLKGLSTPGAPGTLLFKNVYYDQLVRKHWWMLTFLPQERKISILLLQHIREQWCQFCSSQPTTCSLRSPGRILPIQMGKAVGSTWCVCGGGGVQGDRALQPINHLFLKFCTGEADKQVLNSPYGLGKWVYHYQHRLTQDWMVKGLLLFWGIILSSGLTYLFS